MRRSHQAMAVAVAGACLTLCACGATAVPGASGPGPASATASATLAGHFCGDAVSFMRHIPEASTSTHLSQAKARANLRMVLKSTVRGLTSLRAEAPARLRKPFTKIIGVYKSDEKVLRTSGDLATVSRAMVRGNTEGEASFQRVVKYISVSCK